MLKRGDSAVVAARRTAALDSLAIAHRGSALAVVLDVTDASLPTAELQSLAEEAHEKICPYSHATRGNVDVKVVAHGA